jgi:flagellar biosynthesis/type III secretory pathway chaperone
MEKSSTNPSADLLNKIKEMLQHQRFAVRRAASIGMSRDEASEMEARINQIGELVDRLHDRLA